MELATYLQILNRRKWIIILTTLAAMAAYFFIQPLMPTTYKATAILRIIPYTSNNPSYNTLMYADRIMNNYVKIASSSLLMNQLREKLALHPEQPKEISVEIIPDSEMLLITAEDYDPTLAYEAANTMVTLLSEIKINRDIRISVVDPATMPEPPSVLMIILVPVIVAILGITGGVGLAFIIENLDTRLYTTDAIKEVTRLPILGRISKIKKSSEGPYFLHDPNFSNAIRSLRTSLVTREDSHPLKTILVMSAYPKEGKSTVVTNLAISLALTGQKILIIDGDLYFPNIHKAFNLSNEAGLSDLLENSNSIHAVIKDSGLRGISILTSGPKTPKSTELLGSARMSFLLIQLTEIYDHVLIDTPAFLGIPDTVMLAPIVDTVVLIVRRGLVDEAALRTTLQELEQVGVQPVGVVVNHAEKSLPSLYKNYYRSIKDYDPVDNLKLPAPGIETTGFSTDISMDHQTAVDETVDTDKPQTITQKPSQSKHRLINIQGIGLAYEKALKAIGVGTVEKLAEQNPDDLINQLNGRIKKPNTIADWINQAIVSIKRENHSPATKKQTVEIPDGHEGTAPTSKGDPETNKEQIGSQESGDVKAIDITNDSERQVVEDLSVEDIDTNGLKMPLENKKPKPLPKAEDLVMPDETTQVEFTGDEAYQEGDDLSIIHGIGPAYEKALNELGITTFTQLAEQDADDLLTRLDGKVKQAVVVDWIYQAYALVQQGKYEASSPWENQSFDPVDR